MSKETYVDRKRDLYKRDLYMNAHDCHVQNMAQMSKETYKRDLWREEKRPIQETCT